MARSGRGVHSEELEACGLSLERTGAVYQGEEKRNAESQRDEGKYVPSARHILGIGEASAATSYGAGEMIWQGTSGAEERGVLKGCLYQLLGEYERMWKRELGKICFQLEMVAWNHIQEKQKERKGVRGILEATDS
ncbi:hypothetical protein Tco_1504395 [Tanacetum coccineum]